MASFLLPNGGKGLISKFIERRQRRLVGAAWIPVRHQRVSKHMFASGQNKAQPA